MKRILLFLVLLLSFFRSQAQENLYYVEHPHSVTLSSGIPNLIVTMFPPGNPDNSMTMDGWYTGTGYKTRLAAQLNVGYNYQLDRRWELSLILTVGGLVYSQYQYPKTGENDQGHPIYDWQAEPLENSLHYQHRAVIPSFLLRYYWLARKSSFQLYSAAGAGFVGHGGLSLFPTLTLVGTRFGGKHWYGQAELTAGVTATLFLAGVGYRF